jgi:hypothetical protein
MLVMVQRHGDPKTVPDRRSGKERRKTEMAPVKGRDRRRNIEPRRPVVTEIELTPTEWDDLQQQAFEPVPPKSPRKV